jgi:hypothetical protein
MPSSFSITRSALFGSYSPCLRYLSVIRLAAHFRESGATTTGQTEQVAACSCFEKAKGMKREQRSDSGAGWKGKKAAA